jgi:hypothetical protein
MALGPAIRVKMSHKRLIPRPTATPTTDVKPPEFKAAARKRADRDYVPTDVWDEQD